MDRLWVSPASTTTGSVLDPLAAACDDGYVPDTVHFVGNTSLEDELASLREKARDLVAIFGDEPRMEESVVAEEIDFHGFSERFGDAVEEGVGAGAEVAVNMTPGRKFMSAIALQSGLQAGVDHVYYLYITDMAHVEAPYPLKPRTSYDLIDFTEVIG